MVAEKDGNRIAIEIETGKSDSVYNIRKDLEAGFDEVVVVALAEKAKEYLIPYINGIRLPEKKRINLASIKDFENIYQ